MKKKFLAVIACVLTLLCVCTVFAFAEDNGGDGMIWDFWTLLKPENLDLGQLLYILVATVVTFVRMIGGSDGLKEMWQKLLLALKNVIPSK